jgi:hypothetical protein
MMAHMRGAPSSPAPVARVDGLGRRAVDHAVDQGRRAGTGRAGRDDHRVVWRGEAHAVSVVRACEPKMNRT